MLYLIAQQVSDSQPDFWFAIIAFAIALVPSFFVIRWMLNAGKPCKYDSEPLTRELAKPIWSDADSAEIAKSLDERTRLTNSMLIQFLPVPIIFFFLMLFSKEILSFLLIISHNSFNLEAQGTQTAPALNASSMTFQYFVSTGASLIIAFGGIFLVHKLTGFPAFKAFFIGRERKLRDILGAVLILILSVFLIYFVVKVIWYLILQSFGVTLEEQIQIQYLRESSSTILWIATTFAVVVGAPIFEEIVFRGFLYRSLRKYQSALAASATQGFIFALLHLSLSAFLPLWVLGMILALMVEKYNSLLPAIIAHAIFNGITIVMLLSGQ